MSAQAQINAPVMLAGQVVYVTDPFASPTVLLVSIPHTAHHVRSNFLVPTARPLFSAKTTCLVAPWHWSVMHLQELSGTMPLIILLEPIHMEFMSMILERPPRSAFLILG